MIVPSRLFTPWAKPAELTGIATCINDLSIKIDKLNSSENDLQQHISTASQQVLNVTNSPSSVANNIVKELEDKKQFNVYIPEPSTPSWKDDSDFVADLCKDTYNLKIKIVKAFHLGKKTADKCRSLLIHLNDGKLKSKILTKSYLLCSKTPYEDIISLQTRLKLNRLNINC